MERGTRVKIIEAFARGVPVIATPEALYGFKPDARKVVLLYDTAHELTEIIAQIQSSPQLLEEKSRLAREFYEEHFMAEARCVEILAFHEL